MRCPECKSEDSAVTDSRPTKNSIRRRRKCLECGHRWTTYEMSECAHAAINGLSPLSSILRSAAKQVEQASREALDD